MKIDFFFISTSELSRKKIATLSSNTTATSRTFTVLKVCIMKNSDLHCLKAYNLRFILAKFHSTSFSGLVSTWYWNLTSFSPKTAFFSIFLYENCANFVMIEQKCSNWLRILSNWSVLYIFQNFLTIEEVLAKNISKFRICLNLASNFFSQKGVVAKPFEPVLWNFAWKNRGSCAVRQPQSEYLKTNIFGAIKVPFVAVVIDGRVLS